MKSYLEDLVARINVKEEYTSSAESVSWHAYREAEKLEDPSAFGVLEIMLSEHAKKKDKKYRNAVYFIYGNLLKRYPEKERIEFYLDQLPKEADKYVLESMLGNLEYIPTQRDISVETIIELTKSEKWQIRHSAIIALGSFLSAEGKAVLHSFIGQTDEKKYEYEIIYATAALGKIGTEEDLPILETHIKSRKRDVRESAKYAVESVKARIDS